VDRKLLTCFTLIWFLRLNLISGRTTIRLLTRTAARTAVPTTTQDIVRTNFQEVGLKAEEQSTHVPLTSKWPGRHAAQSGESGSKLPSQPPLAAQLGQLVQNPNMKSSFASQMNGLGLSIHSTFVVV
jgi:hypothetical protein